MSSDARGWRMALLPDVLLNPAGQETLPDVLAVLDLTGYGVLQLPPAGAHALLLAVTADQIAEYSHHGYAVVAIGLKGLPEAGLHWRRLSALLHRRGAALPPRHLLDPDDDARDGGAQLTVFLRGYDLPPEVQRHWRV